MAPFNGLAPRRFAAWSSSLCPHDRLPCALSICISAPRAKPSYCCQDHFLRRCTVTRLSCPFASLQFNKSICNEAIELFPKNVTCRTMHAICKAGSSTSYRRNDKLNCTVGSLQGAITTKGCGNVSLSVSAHERKAAVFRPAPPISFLSVSTQSPENPPAVPPSTRGLPRLRLATYCA